MCTREMRFWEKTKKQIWKTSAKSKKKIYEKSWTATASVSKRPKRRSAHLGPAPPVLRTYVPTNLAGPNEREGRNELNELAGPSD
jgi:hypothetical protein